MILSAILAMDENQVIGKDNQLPWYLPADLQHFKKLTWGKPILMGRKTHESIGKPLPGRTNIVITRDKTYSSPGCLIAHSLSEALAKCKNEPEVMVIGGAGLLEEAFPLLDKLYLTQIHHQFEGNVFFPQFTIHEWTEIEKEEHSPDEKNKYAFTFLTLEKKNKVL